MALATCPGPDAVAPLAGIDTLAFLNVMALFAVVTESPPSIVSTPQLRIDFVAVKGSFGPEVVEALSQRLRVPKNQTFIGTPGDRFPTASRTSAAYASWSEPGKAAAGRPESPRMEA